MSLLLNRLVKLLLHLLHLAAELGSRLFSSESLLEFIFAVYLHTGQTCDQGHENRYIKLGEDTKIDLDFFLFWM